jgi:hypothetical protein
VINKQDYARHRGWELHLSAEDVDPTAVVKSQQALHTTQTYVADQQTKQLCIPLHLR